MSDLAAMITAIVGALGMVGGLARFIWNKIEARFAVIETELARCEERDRRGQERRGVQLTVIELLWMEVKRMAPDAPVLVRAKQLLDALRHEQTEREDET